MILREINKKQINTGRINENETSQDSENRSLYYDLKHGNRNTVININKMTYDTSKTEIIKRTFILKFETSGFIFQNPHRKRPRIYSR